MEIKIEDYLSESEIKEIVSDGLREQTRMFFKSEQNAQRLLSNLSYQIVFNEIDKIIQGSGQEIVTNKTLEIISDIKSYSVFDNGKYGVKSLAYKIMEESVIQNRDLIKQKVAETILNKDYSKEIWDLFEEQGDNFASLLYSIAEIGRNKQ